MLSYHYNNEHPELPSNRYDFRHFQNPDHNPEYKLDIAYHDHSRLSVMIPLGTKLGQIIDVELAKVISKVSLNIVLKILCSLTFIVDIKRLMSKNFYLKLNIIQVAVFRSCFYRFIGLFT